MKKVRNICKFSFSLLALILIMAAPFGAMPAAAQTGVTYYVDATGGDDGNNGTSPSSAWQSVFKVNNATFNPGDSILFKRGETWREMLVAPSSGDAGADITFGAYGTGEKPRLLGSAEMNDPGDWYNEGGNIWSTADTKDGTELLSNPSFDSNLSGWTFYDSNGAIATVSRDTEVYDSAPAGARIDCQSNEPGSGSINFFTGRCRITANEWYLVSFRAKSSSDFNIYLPPNISKNDWTAQYCAIRPTLHNYLITPEWATYNFYYLASDTASDAVVFLDLGTMPGGTTLYIDTVSFQKCGKEPLSADVGSLIFNGEESVGTKVQHREDVIDQGDFWYDLYTCRLTMYSEGNPAGYYNDIECALGHPSRHIVILRDKSYVTVENLHLSYGGAHGFRIEENSHDIVIKDCDISYIGGSANAYVDGEFIRFGNGVEIWETAYNCTVEGCRIWEIYDAAITNQGRETNQQYNLYYRNNILWNSEYIFEIWDAPETSVMRDIYIENNVCIGAGFGWGHRQRPDPNGWHLAMRTHGASTDRIIVQNNVFYEASFGAFYHDKAETAVNGLVLDNNYYYQKTGPLFTFRYFYQSEDDTYSMAEFAGYQTDTGYDLNSTCGDKETVREAARAMSRAEDIALLDGLFDTADAMEAAKNEVLAGILDKALVIVETPVPETPEPEITEPTPEPPATETPMPETTKPENIQPTETYTAETPAPQTYAPEAPADTQNGPSVGIIVGVAAGVLAIAAIVIIIVRRRKG